MPNNMNTNWRLQKGNKVEWFDGNKKGTGEIIKPVHNVKDINVLGQTGLVKGSSFIPDGFIVKDDLTGEHMSLDVSKVRKIKKEKKK